MKIKFTNIILCFLLLSSLGCTKIEDMQGDPNRAIEVTPGLILTNIEIQAFNNVSLSGALASRYLTFTDGLNQNQYYGWTRAQYGEYDNLKQVKKMVEEAERTDFEVYKILAKFFNSYFIVEISQIFGDVPYSQAIDVAGEVYAPSYDSQKDIYVKVLEDLQSASNALAQNDETILGDIIYDGNKLKWRKLINSYYLRVLMSLSNKADASELNVIGRFKEIIDNPAQYPLFESNDDNGTLQYYNIQGNRYPTYNNNEIQTAYYMEKTFVDRLKALEDQRLFVFADKKPSSSNAADNDFEAYGGLLGSAPFDENTSQAVAGNASRIAPRYYNDPINEPSLLIGYSELQFILAEAASRGWINGSAEEYYNNGIRGSFNFYDLDGVEDYITNPGVPLGTTDQIASILEQKHIAMFMNTGWQIFYEQRRTGFPEFTVSGGGVLNGGKIPKRWMYPENEATNNPVHLEEAISRQYPEGDNVNGEMWLIK